MRGITPIRKIPILIGRRKVMNKKIFWLLKKSIRYCFPYIAVNIIITLFVTLLSLAINIINKNAINELSTNITNGVISVRFITLIILYIVLHFINSSSGFLIVLGNNFYRLNIDQLFQKYLCIKVIILRRKCFSIILLWKNIRL